MYSSHSHNVNIPNNKLHFKNQISSTINKLSFIVIGAGLIGPRHASHIVSRPDCTLFAIVDHSANGPKVANTYNTRLFKNLQELFDYCELYNTPLPNAAIIATPNHTHLSLGMELANKGIHILMEKPLAPTAIECKTLMTYCQMKRVILLVGHHRRFNPYIVSTKNNLHRLGQIIAVQGCWTLCKPDKYFQEKPWRSSKEKGGGTLLINLIHDLDLLQYLLGPIEKVYAELLLKQRTITDSDGDQVDYEDLVDEGAALTIKFANGCCGTFICSDNVTSPFLFEIGTGENPTIPFNDSIAGFYRIFGSKRTLSLPDLQLYHQYTEEESSWLNPVSVDQISLDQNCCKKTNDNQYGNLTPSPSPDTRIDFDSKPKPFDLQLDHFVQLINGTETDIKCSGEDALRALLCIDAVLKSIETGIPQFVNDLETISIDYEVLKSFV